VMNQIREIHDGELSSSRHQQKTKGTGKIMEQMYDLFRLHRKKYFKEKEIELRCDLFKVPDKGQLRMEL
jgi:adenine-specific DNA methylase